MARFRSLLNLPGTLFRIFETFIDKFPRFYLACLIVFALFGYALVLLFPMLVVIGVSGIYRALTAGDGIAWQTAAVWLVTSLVSGLVSFHMTRYKPCFPAGLTLAEDKAPALFGLVAKVQSFFKRRRIHRIIISPDYELDIIKTPRFALPVRSLNTLIIGLPLMQSISARQLEFMIARRYGQFARPEHPVKSWLYRLRAVWQQHRCSFTKQKGHAIAPLKWLFSLYTPLYSALSLPAARQHELDADSSAMELYNDEEVCRMITADAVCRYYLQRRYWPAVRKVATINAKSIPAPHKKMEAAVAASFKREKLKNLLQETVKARPERQEPVPALIDRIRNIGHTEPGMIEREEPTAAVCYLGDSLDGIVGVMDKLWLKAFLAERKPQQVKRATGKVTSPATGP